MSRTCIIIGNGLTGAFLGVLLSRQGWSVRVFERRGDPRAAGYQGGRSINLALSARGLGALRSAGLEEMVAERNLIPMPGRMIHARDGATTFQPYSKDQSDAINSVSRGGLNLTLMTAAAACPGVELVFDHPCVDADLASGHAIFRRTDGTLVRETADLIIGADGAFSAVRGAMQKTERFEYSQTYLGHGYKELHIPPAEAGGEDRFAMHRSALHIWPRGGAMMIALPNRDGSFTCTLFWPFEGEHSFESLEGPLASRVTNPTPAQRERVFDFFKAQYGDAVPLMPTLVDDFFRNPTSSLVTVRCYPWQHAGRFVLVGDAAHAIVPFYGQGINCGFEDCVELAECLKRHDDLREALGEYQTKRKPNADAIAEMALDNFVEMRDKVGRPEFLYRKRIEQALHAAFPGVLEPQYNLVSFSTVPYTQARQRGRELDRVIDAVVSAIPLAAREGMADADWAQKVRGVAQGLMGGAAVGGQGLIDITPAVTERLGVWPGDTKPQREVLCDIARGDTVTLSTLRSTVHLGAHADGPNHYGKGAAGIGEMPLHHYIGPCVVIRCPISRGSRLGPADIPGGLDSVTRPRVLFATGTFPDAHNWNDDFAALSPELVEALAARGVVTIGIDTPSVDLISSKDLPAHAAFLRHGVVILEGLMLADVPTGEYELMAQPLKLIGFDGSPVRAVLRRMS